MSNIDALADSVATTVKGYVGERFKAFEASIAETFRKMVDALPKPKDGVDGKDADEKAITANVLGDVLKALEKIPQPKDGKDADSRAIAAEVLAEVKKSIRQPEDGKDADPEVVAKMVAAEVSKIPRPENGKDADPLLVQALVRSEVVEAVGKIRVPEDGKSVDPLAVRGMVESEVAAAVGKIPTPSNGKDFDPALLKAEVERAVAALPKPENGKDADPEITQRQIAEAMPTFLVKAQAGLIERIELTVADVRRELFASMAAEFKALPPALAGKDADPEVILRMVKDAFSLVPVPKDGRDGNDGKSVSLEEVLSHLKSQFEGEVGQWELDFERRAEDRFQRLVDRMPRPKDGLGFDDMTVEDVDERTIALVFTRGEEKKRFEKSWPVLIDRGTFKSGDTYERGDAITYGGSLFIAQRETLPIERPEDGSGAFRLAVKRGRDGGGS